MGRSIWPTSDAPRDASRARVRVSSPATTSLGGSSPARCRLRESLAFGGVRHWPTCPARPLRSMRRWTGFTVRLSEEAPFPSLAWRLEVVLWSGTSLSRVRSVSSARRTPSVGLDARPTTQVLEPRHRDDGHLGLGVWPGVLRVGLGEFQLASLPSVSPSQTVRLPRARRPVSYSRQFRTREAFWTYFRWGRVKRVMRDLGSRGGEQLLTEIASCAPGQVIPSLRQYSDLRFS